MNISGNNYPVVPGEKVTIFPQSSYSTNNENVTVPVSDNNKSIVSVFSSILPYFYKTKKEKNPNGNSSISNNNNELPYQFKDCRTKSERLSWLESEQGQTVIKKRPLLLQYYNNNKLHRIIDNKHWIPRLNEWLHIDNNSYNSNLYGVNINTTPHHLRDREANWLHIPCVHSNYNNVFKSYSSYLLPMAFPTKNKYDLLIDGYTIFNNIVPEHIINNASIAISRIICNNDDFQEAHRISMLPQQQAIIERNNLNKPLDAQLDQEPGFFHGISSNELVLALYYCSPVCSLVESILHNLTSNNNIEYRVHTAQVAFRFSQANHNNNRNSKLGGLGWHIDGMDKGVFNSFTFLIGFPLNDQLDDYSGNLCVHPGSHHKLASYVKNYAKIVSNNNDNDIINRQLAYEQARRNKPDLGEPEQIKLSKGDVVFVLHRIAHRGGPNYSNNIRKMVYFRVSHRKHSDIKIEAVDNIWIELEGMNEVLI